MGEMRPTLSPEDEALVREARAHWVRMRDDPEGCGEEPIGCHCALCCSHRHSLCFGCPVEVVTGIVGCIGTPYRDASDKFSSIRSREPGTDAHINVVLAVLEFKQAAQRVIDWVDENLLTEGNGVSTKEPCPFCGGESILVQTRHGGIEIRRCLSDACRTAVSRLGEESPALANEQQLPLEITRAAEGKRDDGRDSRESGGEERR